MPLFLRRLIGAAGPRKANPLCRPYVAADGAVIVLLGMESQRHLRATCATLGHPEWAEAPAFVTALDRYASDRGSIYLVSAEFSVE